MTFDFWQNLQFAIPLVGLAISAVVALCGRRGCRAAGRRWSSPSPPPPSRSRRGTGWSTSIHPLSAGALSRAPGGGRGAGGAAGLHVAARRLAAAAARVFTILRLPAVSRRLVLAMTALLLAAAVPDVVADRPVVGLSRAHARPGRHTRGRHPDARPAAARVARQALRPGLVPAGDERPRQPHARPAPMCWPTRTTSATRRSIPLAGRCRASGVWLGEMILERALQWRVMVFRSARIPRAHERETRAVQRACEDAPWMARSD